MPRSRRNTNDTDLTQSDSVISNFVRSTAIDDNQRINPRVTRQHAIAAANMAYQPHTTCALVDGFALPYENVKTPCLVRELRETQSVRFFGPESRPAPARSITRRIAPSWNEVGKKFQPSPRKIPSIDSTWNPGLDSTTGVNKSSYKRVKKSRSLFSPRKQYMFSTPMHTSNRRRLEMRDTPAVRDHELGEEHSRPEPEDEYANFSNPYINPYGQDIAIRRAQERYRSDIELPNHKYPKSQVSVPSISASISVPGREPFKSFRRTTRTTSGNQYGSSIGSHPTSEPLLKGAGKKARKASATFAARVKKFFGIKSTKTLPVQQVESHRNHWDNLDIEYSDEGLQNVPVIPLQDKQVLRVQSRLFTPYSQLDQRELRGSRSPLGNPDAGQGEDGSRVTSWANSTITNETESQAQAIEKKRLTVIEENDDSYRPSTSTNVGQDATKPRYDAFRWPRKAGIINEPIDSHDIYTALQKRLDEATSRKVPQEESASPQVIRKPSFLRRKFSQTSQLTNRTTVRTVGTVTAHGSQTSSPNAVPRESGPDGFGEYYDQADDVFGPTSNDLEAGQAKIRNMSQPELPAEKQEKTRQRSLREAKSSFFHGQRSKKFGPRGPFMFTTRSSSKDKTGTQDKSSIGSLLWRKATNRVECNDSDSIYSRQVTGTPFGVSVPMLSESRLMSSESIQGFGTATVRDSQMIAKHYSDLISEDPTSGRMLSGASTADWRAWAATQVAGLEGVLEEDRQLDPFSTSQDGSVARDSHYFSGSNDSTVSRSVSPDDSSVRQNTPDVEPAPRSFDYGFATSSIIREQARQASSNSNTPSNRHSSSLFSSETPQQHLVPLTERNHSQSNVIRSLVDEQSHERLSSNRYRSRENLRSQHVATTNDNRAEGSRTTSYAMYAKEKALSNRPSGDHGFSALSSFPREDSPDSHTQTMIVRRHNTERGGDLRHTRSSWTLRERERNSNSKTSYRRHQRVSDHAIAVSGMEETPDSVYDTSGAGLLGPRMAKATRSKTSVSFGRDDSGAKRREYSAGFL